MPKQVPDVPHGVRPIGPYSIATEANGFVFVSGQIPLDPATSQIVEGDVVVQAARVMDNIGLVLEDAGLGFDDVVKTTIFLAQMSDFPTVNGVYGSYFGSGAPARATIEVGALPGGALVEIEAIAAR
jgi:2-iminobutanoate/2-iminopropanoate deaminase